MSEPQTGPAQSGSPSQRGQSQSQRRGRWPRRGPRRGRGGAEASGAGIGRDSPSGVTSEQQPDRASVSTAIQTPPTSGNTPPNAPSPDPRASRGGRGGNRGGNRGGTRGGFQRGGGHRGAALNGGPRGGQSWRQGRGGQASALMPQRAFGGHLTASDPNDDTHSTSALSGDAPEFVPGQPVPPRRSQPSKNKGNEPRQAPTQAPTTTPKGEKSSAEDLATRIHEDIDNRQYECVICTNEVLRNSRVWSCTKCWRVLHLSCVKKWYTNQLTNEDHPQNPDKTTWRCPGCNLTLSEEPGPYHCWCGKDINPSPIVGLPPHSCGQTCSRPRATCPHPCPLECHAGPCPPCALMGPTRPCFCGKHESSKRCRETDYTKGWSCREVCGDMLSCGEHFCSQTCHPGLCGSCELPVLSTCYCGKTRKEIPCEKRGEIQESFNYGQLKDHGSDPGSSDGSNGGDGGNEDGPSSWFEGSFKCSSKCGRPFDCGHHRCEKGCHRHDEAPAHCPLSPDVVLSCPCGKTPLAEICSKPRQTCKDPIEHCEKSCEKPLPCGHPCASRCHTGPCRPCKKIVEIPCRCGRTTTELVCSEGQEETPVCERVCRVQLNCQRHECGKTCCTGEKKALAAKRKGKAAAGADANANNQDIEAEHICLRVCGRTLKCGNHTCQQLCHKGPCPSCLQAIFQEIACACGRTVLYPPQPCGTRQPACRFDCTKPRACGHPAVHHNCHPEDVPCPNCPFLVEKPCICGKQMLKNQQCWFEEARCGLPCGKTLRCGTHKCAKTCHRPGQCEDSGPSGRCTQLCGKSRRSCEHVCIDPCHAPAACREDRPCQSKAFITCDCQRRKQEVRCLATLAEPRGSFPFSSTPSSGPAGTATSLPCDDECLRLQRNRHLADALKIDPDAHTDNHIPYSDDTLHMYRTDVGPTWAQAREREFRVFAADPKEKRLRFKPMQSLQRAFIHSLAEDYGLDSSSLDPEPHRHVCVFKTPRFVSAPFKTLAQCVSIINKAAAAESAKNPTPPSPTAAWSTTPSAAVVQPPFNALILTRPRHGLTIDELEQALADDLSATSARTSLSFATAFLPATDEVLIKAQPPPATAANVARSAAAITPVAVEAALAALKPAVVRKVVRLGLTTSGGGGGGGVVLCRADPDSNVVTRREASSSSSGPDAGGWSAVAGRGAARKLHPTPAEAKPASAFLALGKKKLVASTTNAAVSGPGSEAPPWAKKPVMNPEPVVDDWEKAAETLEDEDEK